MKVPLIYIAGPYRSEDPWQREQNARRAEDVGFEVFRMGGYPIIPHSNTRHYFESDANSVIALAGTLELMRRCDAGVWIGEWTKSRGSIIEHGEANLLITSGQKPDFKIFGTAHLCGDEDGKAPLRRWIEDFSRRQ